MYFYFGEVLKLHSWYKYTANKVNMYQKNHRFLEYIKKLLQLNKKPDSKKWVKKLNRHLVLQRIHINEKHMFYKNFLETHEKMINITNLGGNANQNYSMILLHIH